METITTLPSVRGDAVLLAVTDRGTWRGYESEWLLPAAGLCADACLLGVIDMVGTKTFGIDRRRVVAGPAALADDLPAMLARLGRRCAQVAPEKPWEWVRHAATFAPSGVLDELGPVGERFEGRWHPFGRTPALVNVAEAARSAALGRVERACSGVGEPSPQAVVTALLLQSTEVLHRVVPGARDRATVRRLADARERLPLSARHVVDVVAARKAAQDRIGGY